MPGDTIVLVECISIHEIHVQSVCLRAVCFPVHGPAELEGTFQVTLVSDMPRILSNMPPVEGAIRTDHLHRSVATMSGDTNVLVECTNIHEIRVQSVCLGFRQVYHKPNSDHHLLVQCASIGFIFHLFFTKETA